MFNTRSKVIFNNIFPAVNDMVDVSLDGDVLVLYNDQMNSLEIKLTEEDKDILREALCDDYE